MVVSPQQPALKCRLPLTCHQNEQRHQHISACKQDQCVSNRHGCHSSRSRPCLSPSGPGSDAAACLGSHAQSTAHLPHQLPRPEESQRLPSPVMWYQVRYRSSSRLDRPITDHKARTKKERQCQLNPSTGPWPSCSSCGCQKLPAWSTDLAEASRSAASGWVVHPWHFRDGGPLAVAHKSNAAAKPASSAARCIARAEDRQPESSLCHRSPSMPAVWARSGAVPLSYSVDLRHHVDTIVCQF